MSRKQNIHQSDQYLQLKEGKAAYTRFTYDIPGLKSTLPNETAQSGCKSRDEY
ncbi:hypothetical protein [Pantoea sp. At-9b]|uniref:hypothetical protein n=1 Tax=Pantoea sp. (strain At-9b) TaxID=592316 RepID=UPI0001B40769|nr:hypothetical protein [Pantoea sp. At-9b]